MKKIILIPLLTAILGTSAYANWFVQEDHKREQELEVELKQEQNHSGGLVVVIFILGAGCIATLITGTILGSRTLRRANENK